MTIEDGRAADALSRELQSARSAQGRSLREVAQAAGISPAYLQKLERSRVAEPSPRILRQVSNALGISYARLMETAGYEPPAPPHQRGALADRFQAAGLTETEERAIAAFVEHLVAQRPAP